MKCGALSRFELVMRMNKDYFAKRVYMRVSLRERVSGEDH